MGVSQVVTRGYGPGASIALIVTRGFISGTASEVVPDSDDFTANLQRAIFAALKGTSPTIASGRVFDAVPPGYDATGSNFPYVLIGETQVLTDDTGNSSGRSDDGIICFVTLHVWSRNHRGKAEVHGINTQLYRALHGVELDVTGRASALSWIESMLAMDDPDGVSRHGIVTVRIVHRT